MQVVHQKQLVVAWLSDDPRASGPNNLTLSSRTALLHQLLQLASSLNTLSLMDQYLLEHGAFHSVDKVVFTNLNEVTSIHHINLSVSLWIN